MAQELTIPAQTQYLADNPFSISPVFAGIGDNARIRASGLMQWVGIKDAPINQSLAADFRFDNTNGAGVFFYNDKNGYTRQYGAKFSYAHHLILDRDSEQYLSLGLSFNLNQFKIDVENFSNTFDPGINGNRFTQNYNFDVGFLYRVKDFYLSFNSSNILPKEVKQFNGLEPNLLLNYQVYFGNRFRSNNSNFEFEPSALFQYFQSDGRSTTDLNIKLKTYRYEDYYWLGVTTRFFNDQSFKPISIGPMAGARVKNFYAGYSYQIFTNKLLAYNSGTHMLTIGFDFLQGLSNCPCTQDRIIY
jgi:type IX secretion system PorP/SprF family membrane protein